MKLTSETVGVVDMPKLESLFIREEVNGAYVCVPKVNGGYRWVFSRESEAIEKLDGTNVSITVVKGGITAVHNRKQPILWFKKGNKRFAGRAYWRQSSANTLTLKTSETASISGN